MSFDGIIGLDEILPMAMSSNCIINV